LYERNPEYIATYIVFGKLDLISDSYLNYSSGLDLLSMMDLPDPPISIAHGFRPTQLCLFKAFICVFSILKPSFPPCLRTPSAVSAVSTLEDLDDLEREGRGRAQGNRDDKKPDQDGDAEMKDADADNNKGEEGDLIDDEIPRSSTRDIINRRKLLENDMRIMKSELQRLTHKQNAMKEKIKENLDKIENNRYATCS
jgi:hypothetical protein